ncbi:4897_t:CDS:2, partial [Cetraspora pellucida]
SLVEQLEEDFKGAGIQFASTPYMHLPTTQHSKLPSQSQPILNQTSTNQITNMFSSSSS